MTFPALRPVRATVLSILGIAVMGPHAFAAAPHDRAYTIANYPVDARAKDAVTAKEQALADGQKAALKSLLKRIVPVTAYRSLDRLSSADAATLLDGVSVRNERNSATQYIANLDISFQADAVRSLLTQQGVPFVDVPAPETLLVPIVRDAKASASASGEFRAASGTWSAVWPSLDLKNTVAPLRVETMKPSIPATTLRSFYDGAAGDGARLLSAEYQADRVVVAIADVDTDAGRVTVMLAGEDAVGPFAWSRHYRLSDGDLAYTLELAAVISLGVLEGRWKAASDTSAAAPQPSAAAFNPDGGAGFFGAGPAGQDVVFEALYSGLDEWNGIRRVLLEMPGVDDIRIGSVTSASAAVSVKFPGGGAAFAAALADHGLRLESSGAGYVVHGGNRP